MMNRRDFLAMTGTGVAMGLIFNAENDQIIAGEAMPQDQEIKGAIVLCNHWTECAIGGTFGKGLLHNRWYNSCFSTIFNIEQSRRWLMESDRNRFCHDLDMFFLVALEKEDPQYLKTVIETLNSGRLELVGGTFGQAESQIFGWESALRQLSMGQETAKKYTGHNITTYLVEEQSFFSQMPQMLKLAGFKYASLQFQNSGTPDGPVADLIWWQGPDGTEILTVPNHPGLIGCYKQWSAEPYAVAMEKMQDFRSPLLFQWLELWVPGMDWGASVAPYKEAIAWAEEKGFKQMTLTEYMQWAQSRSQPVTTRFRMDQSNYDNNFFQGGWGYENERQARECNQLESLLLAAESLCTLIREKKLQKKLADAIADSWPRLLISQNHDAYLAGSILFYIDDLKTYQSELTFKQGRIIRDHLQKDIGLHAPIRPGRFVLFNPCPWPVTSPVLLEIDEFAEHGQSYTLSDEKFASASLAPIFRSDSGRLLSSPQLVSLPAFGSMEMELAESSHPVTSGGVEKWFTPDNGQTWQTKGNGFKDVAFGPLSGTWKQIGLFFYDHPNTNVDKKYESLQQAPVCIEKRVTSEACDTVVCKKDLMTIKDVTEPALCLRTMMMTGHAGIDFVELQFRLESIIRLQVGPRPDETWNFQLRLPGAPVAIYADSPYAEEKREAKTFYCSRYIRFELADRDILWCPSQNTLFRNLGDRENGLFDCKVLDFSFNGVTNWGFRFYAARKITPADSIRLAESFHRSLMALPVVLPKRKKFNISTDNQEVVIFHAMPGANSKNVLLRTVNASSEAQETLFYCADKPASVRLVDLLAHVMDGRISLQSHGWRYRFRPWEIATFEIIF